VAKALTAENGADRAELRPWLLMSPALISVGLLLVVPVCFIVVYSFWLRTATGADQAGFHLDNWVEVLTDPFYRDHLIQTLRIAAASTLFCILLGYIPAYFIATSKTQYKALLILLLMLPFWVSYIIRTMSWINILGVSGALNVFLQWTGLTSEPLQILYNEGTVILGLVHFLLPFMHMKGTADRLLGDSYCFSVLAAGRHQVPLGTMGVILGGNIRVGLEDNLTIGPRMLAESNADQVSKVRRIIEELGHELASPEEAREILALKGGDKVAF